MYACMYVCMYVCMYIRTYVRAYVCMYKHVCIYTTIYIYTHVCMYTYIYIYTYLYTHALPPPQDILRQKRMQETQARPSVGELSPFTRIRNTGVRTCGRDFGLASPQQATTIVFSREFTDSDERTTGAPATACSRVAKWEQAAINVHSPHRPLIPLPTRRSQTSSHQKNSWSGKQTLQPQSRDVDTEVRRTSVEQLSSTFTYLQKRESPHGSTYDEIFFSLYVCRSANIHVCK